jgi:hypothetical protein
MWSEARNDAKLRRLDDAEFRVWFNLLCFAAEQEERGHIARSDAFLLAVEVCNGDVPLLKRAVALLALHHLVRAEWCIEAEQDAVTITFASWDRRQYDKPSDRPEAVAERVKRHRAKNETPRNAAETRENARNAEIRLREEKKREEKRPPIDIPGPRAPAPAPARTPAREAPPAPVAAVVNALTQALAYDEDARLSAKEHDRLVASATEILGAGGTPEDVPVRAERYARKYPSIAVTHGGLAGHWGELAVEPPARAPPNGRGAPVTFTRQIETNNAAASEEFLAVMEGAAHGSSAVQRPNEPPRGRLPD